jgi:hypothetical protein
MSIGHLPYSTAQSKMMIWFSSYIMRYILKASSTTSSWAEDIVEEPQMKLFFRALEQSSHSALRGRAN